MLELIIVIAVAAGIFGVFKEGQSKQRAQAQIDARNARIAAAEQYIMESGDPQAIKQLMLMRANPSTYQQQMAQAAAGGNSTMKTAFAVMTGFIAADLITSSLHAAAVSDAMADFGPPLDEALPAFDAGGLNDSGDFTGLNVADAGADDSLFEMFG